MYFAVLIVIFNLFVLRLLYLLFMTGERCLSSWQKTTCRTMIVIGSGGHTSEMLKIVQHLNRDRFSYRIYVMADSDTTSHAKIMSAESFTSKKHYDIFEIPRSRKVHQSYITSVWTTLYSAVFALRVVFLQKPDLILCNGPGTCVPICVAAFLMRFLFINNNAIVFIESICRVKTLSLTGKILSFFADLIIVQWPELKKLYKNTTYIGDVEL